MPPPDSSLLPDPPPPRPDRREQAIAAALRRFDGVEDAPSPAERPRPSPPGGWWARSRQPQFAMAMSLALIAVIGLPATWIALRNGAANGVAVPSESSSPAARHAPSPASPEAMAETPTAPAPAGVTAPSPPLLQAEPKQQASAPSIDAKESADRGFATPAPAPAAPVTEEAVAPPPPPPPPPPAAPPPAAEKARGVVSNDIAITGSRIPQPNLTSASPVTVVAGRSAERDEADTLNSLPAKQAATAPDRALKDRAYSSFLSQLQSAVRSGNRDGVVKLVALPLRVNSNGKSKVYRDAASVRADYDKIFTAGVRRAILSQKFGQLFVRDQGVMIGDGQVWFDHVGSERGPVRITAINR